ncbi:MAG: hypothetical protein NVS2B17_24210 [Candidatus Velthaea sp.]
MKKISFLIATFAMQAILIGSALAQSTPSTVPQSAPGSSAATAGAVITGTVVDRSTGLPLSGVLITAAGTAFRTTAGADGSFRLALPPGIYTLQAVTTGYNTQQTDSIVLTGTQTTTVTLALERAQGGSTGGPQIIGRSSSKANDALQPATVIQHTVSASEQFQQGKFSSVDALKDLTNVTVVNAGGISTPGIDVSVTLHGLGIQQLIDGHPTTVALNSVNFAPFQSINVVYGSGKGELYPINAIGGVIDYRTISPTLRPSATLVQGFGTFGALSTSLNATGSMNKFGYALSVGSQGVDAPYGPITRYQPRNGFDPSATAPDVAARNFYTFNASSAIRSEFAKLVYKISPALTATGTFLGSTQLEDNDGNKSVDFFPYNLALINGMNNLSGKKPADPCPAGTFTATNFKGVPYGTGPTGLPDGGQPCQSPASYAALNSGYRTGEAGAIATNNNDNDLRIEANGERNRFVIDAFGSLFKRSQNYRDTSFVLMPGDLNGIHTKQTHDSNAGFNVSDDLTYRNVQVGAGFYTNNYRQDEIGAQFDQNYKQNGGYLFTYGNAVKSVYGRVIYHPESSPLSIYAYDYIKNSKQPNAWFNDPRLALLYRRGNNTLRLAGGVSSSLPYAPDNATFQPVPLADFSKGLANPTNDCKTQHSIGTAGAGFTKPERAADVEGSIAHRWFRDSFTQVELYAQNFSSEVQYGTNAPLSFTGVGGITNYPAYLAAFQSACGTTIDPLTQLTLQGNYNLGRVLAQGVDISGRQRVSRNVSFDYTYGIQSVSNRSLPGQFVIGSKTTIINNQFNGIPLHNASLALDVAAPAMIHGRLVGYYTGPGNQNGLPGYTRTDLQFDKTFARRTTVTFYVYNLFQYKAFYDQIDNSGIAVPLSSFAVPSDYTPFFGPGNTNQVGIGPRRMSLTFAAKL